MRLSRIGASLLETVIALFLLTGAGLSVFYLFDKGVHYLGKASQYTTAIMVAENNLAELRKRSRDPGFFPGGVIGLFGAESPDATYSAFSVRFDGPSSPNDSLSPSTQLESNWPESRRRVLERTILPVRCTVSWGGNQNVSLLTYLSAPPRPVDPLTAVRVTRTGPGSVAPFNTTQFEARLEDTGGNKIPGVTFSWGVDPLTGNGTIDPTLSDRDGESVVVENKYTYNILTDAWGVRPGNARARAVARYNGVEMFGVSDEFSFTGTTVAP